MIRRLATVCLLCAGLFAAGCNSTPAGTVQIPLAPAWQQPADARPVSGYEAQITVLRVAPLAKVSGSDATYTRVSHVWLERYVTWTWAAAKAMGLRYVPESFDCENFATLFCEIAAKKAADAGSHAAPLVAVVTVSAPGGARHAMVGVATDRGLFIVEPQPDAGPFRIKPVADYRGRILSVVLGAYNP